jgi:hypothetical protein
VDRESVELAKLLEAEGAAELAISAEELLSVL